MDINTSLSLPSKGLSSVSEEEISSGDLIALLRAETVASFWMFCLLFELEPRFNEEEHKPLCDFLQDFRSNGDRIACVIASRDTLKTTICSVLFPLWSLCANPNMRFLLFGRVHDQAQQRLGAIKSLIDSKPMLNACFHSLRPQDGTWNANAIDIGTRTDFSAKEHSIETGGFDVEKTGIHCDIIVADDTTTKDNYRTREQIDANVRGLRELVPLATRTKRENGLGKILYVNTPWGEGDAVGWFLGLDIKKKIYMKRAYEPEHLDIVSMTEQEFIHSGGRLNFPNSLPFETLKENRIFMGSALFFSQYQLSIVAGEDAKFDAEKIKRIKRAAMPKGLRVFITVDPAGDPDVKVGRKKDGCDVAIAAVGFDSKLNLYLVDAMSGKFTENETVNNAIQMIRKHGAMVCGVETTGLGNIMLHLRDRLVSSDLYASVEAIRPAGRSKFERLSGLAPIIEAGCFHVVDDIPSLSQLIHSISRVQNSGIPAGLEIDLFDAIAMSLDLVKKYGKPMADMDSYAGSEVQLPEDGIARCAAHRYAFAAMDRDTDGDLFGLWS